MDLKTLARKLSLPETATEAQIEAALARRTPAPTAAPDTVTALAREVATLRSEREADKLAGVFEKAAREGRLTKATRLELSKRIADVGVDGVAAIVESLPVVVDLAERGRDGDAPRGFRGQLSPGAVAILAREDPAALKSIQDTRSLKEKRDAVLAEAREARLSRRAS